MSLRIWRSRMVAGVITKERFEEIKAKRRLHRRKRTAPRKRRLHKMTLKQKQSWLAQQRWAKLLGSKGWRKS